jgi:NADH-quinone oxidoreductase subunit L
MPILDYLWVIIALPLVGSAINGFLGSKFSKPVVNTVAIGAVTGSFLYVIAAVHALLQLPGDQVFTKTYFTWIRAGIFQVDFKLQMDHLTVVMLLVVTGVGLLVHIYSTG